MTIDGRVKRVAAGETVHIPAASSTPASTSAPPPAAGVRNGWRFVD
jgi:hypothetical protein